MVAPVLTSLKRTAIGATVGWLDGRHQTLSPAAMARAQAHTLGTLVAAARGAALGRSFHLDRLPASAVGPELVKAFRATVPVTVYADYEGLIARVAAGEAGVMFPGRAAALAQTSGTTSTSQAGERYVPQSAALLDHHAASAKRALVRLAKATGPDLLMGRTMMLGGSTALTKNAHGIPAGDLSGITVSRIPWYLEGGYEPGRDIALEADWERKLTRIVERCAHRDISLVSGIPSWLLVLFERVRAARGAQRIRDAWPHLRGMIHGGHAIEPFLPRLREELSGDTLMMEVYPASEAFIAISREPWRLDGQPGDMETLADTGVFLEFLPDDGRDGAPADQAVGPEGLADGRIYRVLLTTPAGLVRYQLGDLVRGAGPGRLRFAGRIKTRISVFGEHVEGQALAVALGAACADTGAEVAQYHVAPLMPSSVEPRGRHEWWVEFTRQPQDLLAFSQAIDRHLRRAVMDYDAHRAGDLQLLPPGVVAVPMGTFNAWLAAAGKLGGQHKVPQAWPDHTIADALARQATGLAGGGTVPHIHPVPATVTA